MSTTKRISIILLGALVALSGVLVAGASAAQAAPSATPPRIHVIHEDMPYQGRPVFCQTPLSTSTGLTQAEGCGASTVAPAAPTRSFTSCRTFGSRRARAYCAYGQVSAPATARILRARS